MYTKIKQRKYVIGLYVESIFNRYICIFQGIDNFCKNFKIYNIFSNEINF